jgi:alkylated DNA nucleotide flippase Atl1
MNSRNETVASSSTFRAESPGDNDYIARIKVGYESMPANAKVTYGRLAEKAGIDRRTVEKIMKRYPNQFRHIRVQRSHMAGR